MALTAAFSFCNKGLQGNRQTGYLTGPVNCCSFVSIDNISFFKNTETGIMKKIVISVLGQDRPGIIARLSGALFHQDCNIENVSQTILQSEFSGIFIVSVPPETALDALYKDVSAALDGMGLYIHLKEMKQDEAPAAATSGICEPFVITTRGPDRKGLVATITGIIARYNVNVTNLKAVFKGGDDPDRNIMIYEVDIPEDTDMKALDTELREKAGELELTISIQHRSIFEAINRI